MIVNRKLLEASAVHIPPTHIPNRMTTFMKNMLSFQAEIYATNVAVKEIILFYFLSTLSKAISYCSSKAQKSIETGLHNRQKAAYVLTEQENNSLQ